MKFDRIENIRSLKKWLQGKPYTWEQTIAFRSTMRAIPVLSIAQDDWLDFFALVVLRPVIVLDALKNHTGMLHPSVISTAVTKAKNAANSAHPPVAALGRAAANALETEYDVEEIAHDLSGFDLHSNAIYAIEFAITAICTAEQDSVDAKLREEQMWRSVRQDCHWLERNATLSKFKKINNRNRLWSGSPPMGWPDDWARLKSSLLRTDRNYLIWTDWYERRVRGERASFDIPGDKGRIEEKKILRRLAEATDEDFWGKGHEYVNAELSRWLEEARKRAAANLPPVVGEASGQFDIGGSATGTVGPKPDPQDARSPQFGRDTSGRIAINTSAGADQLRSDPQSLSRHARALQMAQKLGEALRNHNNAGYMTEMASDYVAAMEGGPDGPDPSGLVFAGDQLREAIAKHRAATADDDLQPLPPSADRDASAFLSAHNMYVGSDPFLDDLDRTTRGPDALLPAANPDEIRRVATIARDDEILAIPTYDYMIAASDAAPANYNQADRHSRFAAGLAQNFARYGIELLWAYPSEAAWASLTAGALVTVSLGPLAAAGGTMAGIGIAYHMARNMIANEAIYEKLLATSPAGEDNFNRLMRFLKSLPIKSLKDG